MRRGPLLPTLLVALHFGAVAGCGLIEQIAPVERCPRVHQIEDPLEPRTDLDKLSKVVQLPVSPERVYWTKGALGGGGGGTSDWELIALLELGEGATSALVAEDLARPSEVELPAIPWLAQRLGLPVPATGTDACAEPPLVVTGFRYDGRGFERYFLRTRAFLKIPERRQYLLWMSTRALGDSR